MKKYLFLSLFALFLIILVAFIQGYREYSLKILENKLKIAQANKNKKECPKIIPCKEPLKQDCPVNKELAKMKLKHKHKLETIKLCNKLNWKLAFHSKICNP